MALPAHYSAITSVLLHLKQRLGSQLRIEHIIDWGSGTGSGLWLVPRCHQYVYLLFTRSRASLYAFQDEKNTDKMTAIASTIKSYVALEKREGLATIGEKLVVSE